MNFERHLASAGLVYDFAEQRQARPKRGPGPSRKSLFIGAEFRHDDDVADCTTTRHMIVDAEEFIQWNEGQMLQHPVQTVVSHLLAGRYDALDFAQKLQDWGFGASSGSSFHRFPIST